MMHLPKRWLSLLAVWPLLGAASAPASETNKALPVWLIGTWTPIKVYQLESEQYDQEPKDYMPRQLLTISAQRLSFVDAACQAPKATRLRGPMRVMLNKAPSWPKGISPAEYGMNPDPKPVDYLQIHCAQLLDDSGDGRGMQPVGRSDTWLIARRSPDIIEMPFYHLTYVVFRRVTPTS